MTDTSSPEESSMAAKLKGDGPLELTEDEANELRDTLRAVFKRDNQLQGLNTMMSLALYRKRLQVVHRDHDDGSISFDLEPAPPDPLEDVPAIVN